MKRESESVYEAQEKVKGMKQGIFLLPIVAFLERDEGGGKEKRGEKKGGGGVEKRSRNGRRKRRKRRIQHSPRLLTKPNNEASSQFGPGTRLDQRCAVRQQRYRQRGYA